MKVMQIISILEGYNAIKAKLRQDTLNYQTYKILEPDEKKEKFYFEKIKEDKKELGKYLDMEI